jgi:glycolate oxidase FAD binding subunit
LARFVAENAEDRQRAVYAVGGRTALRYGYAATEAGVTVATGELNDVADYPARDMTITVGAGIRVEELQELLAGEGQRIPVDVPQAHRASLGGAIATNTSGPGRFAGGTFRDCVIGISAVDGMGRPFSAGGRVVKNVAGYDLCKLLVGSLGTLAVITQVTLRLLPIPETRQAVWASCESLASIEAALARLNESATRPVAVEVLNAKAAWQVRNETGADLPSERPVLSVFFDGGAAETDWQIEQCRSELSGFTKELVSLDGDPTHRVYSTLVEYQSASDDPLSFQASMPLSRTVEFARLADDREIALQAHGGNGIVVGHLPDTCTTAAEAGELLGPLRSFAEQCRGALVVLNCDNSWKSELSLFGHRNPHRVLDERVRQALDPHDLLNPGRMGRGE